MKQSLMSGNEKREIELLIALHESTDQGKVLEKRMRDAGVWQLYRTAKGSLDKVVAGLCRTMPDKQLRNLTHYLSHAEVTVKLPSVSKSPSYTHLHKDEVVFLLDKIMNAECKYCMLEGKEIDKCQLKKVLDNFGVDLEEKPFFCKYSGLNDEAMEKGG